MKEYKFYQNPYDDTWWIDIPEWEDDPNMLQMVRGADVMLSYLLENKSALHTNQIYIDISFEQEEGVLYDGVCILDREENEGGVYEGVISGKFITMWLSKVIRYIYNSDCEGLPSRIYLKVNN